LASSSSIYSESPFGNRLQALQRAQTQRRVAEDGQRVDKAAAMYSAIGQGNANTAPSPGKGSSQGPWSSLAQQTGGVIGDAVGGALGRGIGSLFQPKTASNPMETAWKTGFSMKGSLLG